MKPTHHRHPNPKRPAAAVLVALALFTSGAAAAAPPCLKADDPCNPDKLCTFKASYAEKLFLYQTYMKNSQVTKSKGKRDGVRYSGALYDASVAEARNRFPDDSAAEQNEKAGQIFQEKVKEYAQQNFRMPTCRFDGTADLTLLPKPGYGGMFTTPKCQIRANYNAGDYDADGFGSNDATSCPEFYDRDRAHEVIHQRRCQAAEKAGTRSDQIGPMIEEEIVAYEHSVKLSRAYMRLLSIQCSARATPAETKRRARAVEQLLTPYLAKTE